MNSAITTADHATHAKIVVVALISAIVVTWIAIANSRQSARDLHLTAPVISTQIKHGTLDH